MDRSVCDYIADYGVIGRWSGDNHGTAEECYNNLDLNGKDKPDKEDFSKKVNERAVYYQMEELRRFRDKLLTESDWTQSRDLTLTNDEAWKKYRQDLRDLPQTTTDIINVIYPTKPQ